MQKYRDTEPLGCSGNWRGNGHEALIGAGKEFARNHAGDRPTEES